MARTKWQMVVVLLASAGFLFLPTDCSMDPVQAQGPVKITIATSAEPNSGDFHQAVGTISRQLAANIGDALVVLDENLKVQPALAQSWSQESPTAWVFHLRRGVKFQDGTPFNAAAVKFDLERLLTPPPSRATRSCSPRWIGSKMIDDATVRLRLERPFAPLVRTLAYILGYMASPTAVKAASLQDYGRAPIATGPSKLTQWVAADHITLVANKDYWRGAPKIDEITWKFVRSPPAAAPCCAPATWTSSRASTAPIC